MRGAMVFLVVFVVVLFAALAYPSLPPGGLLYHSLGVQETETLVLGIPATALVSAVFGAVVYAVIAWLTFTFAEKARTQAKPSLQTMPVAGLAGASSPGMKFCIRCGQPIPQTARFCTNIKCGMPQQ